MALTQLIFGATLLPIISILFPFYQSGTGLPVNGGSQPDLMPYVSCGRPAFTGYRYSDTFGSAQASTVADFNGDGRPDLAVQSGFGGTVSVQLGIGNGYFGSPNIVDPAVPGGVILSGDFNNDGRMDLLTSTRLYFGDGAGNFSSPRVVQLETSGQSFTGDFNGDDNLDVAFYKFTPGNVEVFYGDGYGGFATPSVLSFSGTVSSFNVGDLNGDGITDIFATLNSSNTVSVALASPTGVFQTSVDYPIGGTAFVSVLSSGDLDGDGDLDIIAANNAFGGPSASMVVLLNNGNGDFAVQSPFVEPSTNLASMITADVNQDGKMDVLILAGGSTITLRLGNNDGTFQPSQSLPGFVGQGRMYFEDFTGDGVADLGLPSSSVAGMNVLVNDGNGRLGPQEFLIDTDNFLVDMASEDFNHDGHPDIVYATTSTNVKVAFGDAKGNFDTIVSLPVSRTPQFMITGDVNNDGNADILLIIQNSGETEQRIAVLFSNGDGTFQTSVETTVYVGAARKRPILADFNGDGLPDIVMSISNSLRVSVLRGAGNGLFQGGGSITLPNTVGGFAAGDFDGDGNMDLAVLSFEVAIYRGNGAFYFERVAGYPDVSANSKIATTDLNGDGILDIVATTDQTGPSPASGKIAVLLGIGNFGFEAPTEYPVGRAPSEFAFADFDGDGNKDIGLTNSGYSNGPDSRVSIMYGDGSGKFPRLTFTGTAPNPRGLIVGDFNGDSHLDLISAGYNLGDVVESFGQCLAPPATNLPTLSVNDASVNEGNVGDLNTASVTVTLSAPSTTTIRVRYYTAPLVGIANLADNELFEARSRIDYRPITGELTFLPGETSKTLQVAAIGDSTDEYDEKLSVFLADATNAGLGDNQGIVTIIDDDAPPTLSVGNGSGLEGNTGNSPINIPLTLSAVSDKPISVQFVTGGGTAVPNLDYLTSQGTVNIPAGQTTGTITVNTIGDMTVEPDETFLTQISEPTNVTIANTIGTGTIVNDDIGGSVQFSSVSYLTTESSGIQISITRSGGNGGGVSVRFMTQAGTATPGQDYTEIVRTLVFAENETVKNVFIPITVDQLDEPDETVNLILDTPNGVTLGTPASSVLTIQNTPNVPNLSITDASLVEGDNGVSNMLFSVRLSKPTQQTVTVDYSTSPGTATPGTDYIPTSGTFTLRRGATWANLSVPIVGDFMFEPDETFFVDLSNAVNANLVGNHAVGRIINDELSTTSSLQLVSVNRNNNGSGNNDSLEPSMSADGKIIAFESYASDLVSNDANGVRDVYVWNSQTGVVTLVSVNLAGNNGGNCESRRPAVSGDGRFVVFNSCASDLTDAGAPSPYGVFLRDLQTNQTRMVSVTNSGTPGSVQGTMIPSISRDGRYVVFQSSDQNLTSIPDTQNFIDIFVRDMQTNTTSLVSINSSGNGPANADSGNPTSLTNLIKITPDGRYILFPSAATDLVTTPANGATNLFVRDVTAGTTIPVSVNIAGSQLVGSFADGTISDNGRYVFFASSSDSVTANDTNTVTDVFRRDLQAGTSLLVSINQAGIAGGNAESKNPWGSADGRFVAFESTASDISSSPDTNSLPDIYWRDINTGTTKLVSVNHTGTNGGNQFSSTARLSADGQTVLFTTAASDLVPPPLDNNSNFDVYIRDIVGNYTKPVTANQSGTATGNQPSRVGIISDDGNVAAFPSTSSNLVTNDTNGFAGDIFVFTKNLPKSPLTDFDGDGKTDLGVFRPSTSVWYISNSSNGAFRAQQFGLSTDIPVAGDYDGDGKTDIAVFRDGVWYALGSQTNTVMINSFGQVGDVPIVGDFDGDRKVDLSIFRQGVWQIRESSDGNVRTQQFGQAGDVPVAADFDGDRRSDIAIFRDGVWYIVRSTDFGYRIEQFGSAGDEPVQGDFNGDQIADLAVFRPATGVWYILYSGTGAFSAAQFGITTDVPLKGDFDGDGKADISIFRNGVWYILRSSDQNATVTSFGLAGDTAIASR